MSCYRCLLIRGSVIALLLLMVGVTAKLHSQTGRVSNEVIQNRLSSLAVEVAGHDAQLAVLVQKSYERDIANERRMTAIEAQLDGITKLLWGLAMAYGVNLLVNILEKSAKRRASG